MKNIYVGNLDIDATEKQVRELFEVYGVVERVAVVRDRDTGHPRGFAFVEMANDDQALAAITALNGATLAERPLEVNEARPNADHEASTSPELRDHRRHRL